MPTYKAYMNCLPNARLILALVNCSSYHMRIFVFPLKAWINLAIVLWPCENLQSRWLERAREGKEGVVSGFLLVSWLAPQVSQFPVDFQQISRQTLKSATIEVVAPVNPDNWNWANGGNIEELLVRAFAKWPATWRCEGSWRIHC